ncbi:hypothetical protein [Catellatospora sp. TT07R-123]|uniref:hypothetical protein n=1 Tax=Catellatospora sp. TT07R-123 TaxID=2733863 RepID=UPI001BB458B1|nr:hypothetical protein [Catellatospora sp. TT07R-123]
MLADLTLSTHPDLSTLVAEQHHWRHPGHHLPIVVLTAPAGGGALEAIRELEHRYRELPSALIDLAPYREATVVDVLAALADRLSLGRPHRSSLIFPRFLLGLLAARSPNADGKAAMAALQADFSRARVSEDLRAVAAKATRTAAEIVSGASGVPLPVIELAWEVFRLVRRGQRSAADRWWMAANGRPSTDALLQLRNDLRSNIPAEVERAELSLGEAFLADLRDAYRGGVFAGQPPTSALALIANVQTDAGQRLLELITQARARAAASPDPLLIVVTAAADLRLLNGVPPAGATVRPIEPTVRTSWLHPITIDSITEDQLVLIAGEAGVINSDTARRIWRLTGGHRGALAAVLTQKPSGEALRKQPEDLPPWLLDAFDPPSHDLSPLVGAQLAGCLPGMSPELTHQLITCSAVRRFDVVELRAALDSESARDVARLRIEMQDRLWLGSEGMLHPWLRWLLREHLRHRADDGPSWAAVHDRLHQAARTRGDTITTAYHRLAGSGHEDARGRFFLDGLRDTAAELDRCLDEQNGTTWTDALLAIGDAPNGLPRRRAVTIGELTGWSASLGRRRQLVARLVAALWIDADPLLGARSEIASEIVNHLIELSGLVPASAGELIALSRRFERRRRTL